MRARGIESHITSMHDGFYPIAFKMCSRVALAKAFTVSDFLQGGSYVLRGGKDKQRKPSSQVDKKKTALPFPTTEYIASLCICNMAEPRGRNYFKNRALETIPNSQ